MSTRARALATLAEEITAFAEHFQRKDPKVVDDLEHYVAETLPERMGGEWAAFESLVMDVEGSLDPSNAGCEGYDDKFTKHIVKYTARLRDKAAGKSGLAREKKK